MVRLVSIDHTAKKIVKLERDNKKINENAHPHPKLTGKKKKKEKKKPSKQSDLQKKILPQWQSALKWGLGEVEPGSTPSGHTAALPSPMLPQLTQCPPQVINKRLGCDSTVPIQHLSLTVPAPF